jgi:hypothetical protein
MEIGKERISLNKLPFFMHYELNIGKKVFITLLLSTWDKSPNKYLT